MKKTTFLTKAATLLFAVLFSLTGARAEELTVHSGNQTNSYIPAYISRFRNYYTRSQFIIPASDLVTMKDCSITTVKFYVSGNTTYTGTCTTQVYMKEVDHTTFTSSGRSYTFETGGTRVYEGTLSVVRANNQNTMTITFNTPYTYHGGNLLIDIENTTTGGSNTTINFLGTNTSNAACYGSGSSIPSTTNNRASFIPQTTFTYYHIPTNVTVSNITPNSADVTWDGVSGATGYELQYGAGDYLNKATLSYDDGTRWASLGNEPQQSWTWGVMYPASQVTASLLTSVSIYETAYNTGDITIKIYSGGDTAPGTLLHTETVATEAADAFHEVKLATPVAITPGQNLWITLTETGTYVMSLCDSDESNNQWVYLGNYYGWGHITDVNNDDDIGNYGFMIRAEINDGIDPSISWTTVNPAFSPCTLSGLNPDTHYLVRVKALYGNNESGWEINGFTTLVSNPAPIDVVVDPSYTSANLEWTGYASNYEVKYRKVSFFDDFTNGLGRWTIYTEGDKIDGNDEGWIGINGMAAAYSWLKTGPKTGISLNANNWLVTPEVELGGTLKFWAYSSWGDEYEVLLSTTDNAIGNFTTTLKAMGVAPNPGAEVSIDLSAYEGQTGYIAIHHVHSGGYYIDIDNFEISNDTWKTATTGTNSIELTDLEPGTEYEFIITGIKEGCPNASTPVATFTTLDGALAKIAWFGYSSLYYGKKNLKVPGGVQALTFNQGDIRMNVSHIYEAGSVIPAGTAVILKGEPGDYIFPASDESGVADPNNKLKGFDVPTRTEPDSDDYYYYVLSIKKGSNDASTVGFYWNNSTGGPFTSAAHKAYLPIMKSSSVKSFYLFSEEDDPTGIDNVNDNLNLNDEVIYNIAGQRIGKMQKGINIVNGKKILK